MYYSQNLLFNSDLPMDKVIWLYEGKVTSDNNGSWSVTIPHNLGAMPFVKGVWSNNNWSTTWMTNASRQNGQSIDLMSNLASDKDKVYFSGFSSVKNNTILYKLWGVWNEVETYSIKAEFTKSASKNNFILNSDYNYPQLVMEGYLTKGNSITHGLGFIPYCDVWAYVSGFGNDRYEQKSYSKGFTTKSDEQDVKITSTALTLVDGVYSPSKIYYRIYAT